MSIFGKIMARSSAPRPTPRQQEWYGYKHRIASSTAPAQSVDVAPILDKAVAAKGEKLAWRTSIVDLMKALDIDSSLGARKELAKELGFTATAMIPPA